MKIGLKRNNEIVLAATVLATAVFVLLLSGPSHAPSPAGTALQKPQVAPKPQVAHVHKKPHRRHLAAVRYSRRPKHKVPVPATVADQSAPGASLPVQFPQPTKITIAMAAAPQLVKLAGRDRPLQAGAQQWMCVQDRTTGLVWETKTHDRGLRDAQNFYSWYEPVKAEDGGYAGVPDHGKCRGGIACDTHAYIQAVNRMKLCGYSDWRLPTRAELSTLIEYHPSATAQGLVDAHYFPSDTSGWYWSADSDRDNPRYAWYVLYYNGREMKAPKSQAKRIRLVRGPVGGALSRMAQQPSANPPAHSSIASGQKVPAPVAATGDSRLAANSPSTRRVD